MPIIDEVGASIWKASSRNIPGLLKLGGNTGPTLFDELSGNLQLGSPGIPGMTSGFLMLPAGAGPPGTPTSVPPGYAPMYFNTLTRELNVFANDNWSINIDGGIF